MNYRDSDGVIAPVPIRQVAPLYSDEARKAKYSGAVKITFVVGLDGTPERIEVTKRMGLGLDEVTVTARYESGNSSRGRRTVRRCRWRPNLLLLFGCGVLDIPG